MLERRIVVNYIKNKYEFKKVIKKTNNNRLVAILIATFILFNILINIGYSVSNAYHNCTHENCKICIEINDCIVHINKYGISLSFFNINNLFNIAIIAFILILVNKYFYNDTLVSLKVRLDI